MQNAINAKLGGNFKSQHSLTLLAICACLLWSSAFVGIKIGLQYTTPLQFAGIRFMLSALMILPFCGGIVNLLTTAKQHPVIILHVTFFQTILLYTLFYAGIDLVPAALAAMIIGSQPLIIAVMAHFVTKDDKMTLKKGLSILLGLVGVILISFTRGRVSLDSSAQLLGIVLLMGSNISAGIGNLLVARSKTKSSMGYLSLNCIQLFCGGAFMFFLSIPFEGVTFELNEAPYYYSLIWLSFLSAAALSIWFHLLQSNVLVSNLNIWKFLIPVSGACLSWLVIEGESPDLFSVVGMIFIVLALIILHIRAK